MPTSDEPRVAEPHDFSLALGGPLYQLFRRSRLTGDTLELLHRRILVLVSLTWVPLLLLSVVEGAAWGGRVRLTFLHDVDTHVLLLAALPLLLVAELVVNQRLRVTVRQFVEHGLIPDAARARFGVIIVSAMRLRNSIAAEVLKQNGYNTSWYGKNHNVPDWMTSQAGPFDLWPTGLGFEYFYGFIGGDTSQWSPALFEGTKPIEPALEAKDYFFDKDMADHTINWIRMQHATAPGKPFLAYYAPGTAHAPHHAPKEWIAKFKGKFDQGWDKVREETFARQKARASSRRTRS